jgi:bleomycin hydrolase
MIAFDKSNVVLVYYGVGDGGQWSMAVNIIIKHGLVPASVYPESDSSGGTLAMNGILKDVLRTAGCELRHKRQHENASMDDLRVFKEQKMSDIWKILAMHLGTPPETFSWEYYDKSNKHSRLTNMTPLSFVDQYVDAEFSSYVCLVNDPRNPYMKTYTVDYLQVCMFLLLQNE